MRAMRSSLSFVGATTTKERDTFAATLANTMAVALVISVE